MSQSQNWRTETNAEDYFNQQRKQLQLADRRPVIRTPADLVGPGIGASAIRITSFDDILATYDGYFSYEFVDAPSSTAAKAPNTTDSFVGFITQDNLLGGVQTFYSLTPNGRTYRRTFLRNPMDPSSLTWSNWTPATITQSGTYNFLALGAGDDGTQAVSFTTPFPSTPVVVSQVNYNSGNIGSVAVAANSVTASGFTLRVRNNTGGSINLPTSWIAVLN